MIRAEVCIGEGMENKVTPEPQALRLGAFQVPKKCPLSSLKMLGLRIRLGTLELVNSKSKLRPGPVSNPSQSAHYRPVPVSIKEISLETRGRRKVRGMVHGGPADRQVVKPDEL